MEWSDYITQEYLKWRGDSFGRDGTINDFAKGIGVSQSLMTQWMKKGGKRPTSQATISKLVKAFGYEVYDVLGLPWPGLSTITRLPRNLRKRLEAAAVEVEAALKANNITGESPEAERIAIQIFEEHGFKYTDTERED